MKAFIATRSELEVITVDSWLQEMLTILEEAAPGARARVLERIRRRMLGADAVDALGTAT